MTRISTFIALLTLVFAARWSHQKSPTATDGRGDDLNGSDLESGGVEAEYSICFTIPATRTPESCMFGTWSPITSGLR